MFDLSDPQKEVTQEFESFDDLKAALAESGIPADNIAAGSSFVHNGRHIEIQHWRHTSPPVWRLYIGALRYTESVALRPDHIEKLESLRQLHGAASIENVLAGLITGAPLDKASYAPIYQEVYVWSSDDDPSPYAVNVTHVSGNFTARLRRVAVTEIKPDDRVYVVVAHELKYPRAAVDFVEIVNKSDFSFRLLRTPLEPRQFCEAALVGTPKLALIG